MRCAYICAHEALCACAHEARLSLWKTPVQTCKRSLEQVPQQLGRIGRGDGPIVAGAPYPKPGIPGSGPYSAARSLASMDIGPPAAIAPPPAPAPPPPPPGAGTPFGGAADPADPTADPAGPAAAAAAAAAAGAPASARGRGVYGAGCSGRSLSRASVCASPPPAQGGREVRPPPPT